MNKLFDNLVCIVDWCNSNTKGSCPLASGAIPGSATKEVRRLKCYSLSRESRGLLHGRCRARHKDGLNPLVSIMVGERYLHLPPTEKSK